MTVVAAYRGMKGSLNAMMADTICSARDKPAEAAFWADKLALLYGHTYAIPFVRTITDRPRACRAPRHDRCRPHLGTWERRWAP
jgi:hypothetical protein